MTYSNYQNFPLPMPPAVQRMIQQRNQQPQFNLTQFKQLAKGLNQPLLNQLVVQARQQGISDQDINAGLQLINSL